MGTIREEWGTKYGYGDITIIPKAFTNVRHRKECNPFVKYTVNTLPIFTAPMSQIVDCENYDFFEKSGINAILPRNIDYNKRISFLAEEKWVAFGLDELTNMTNKFPKEIVCGSFIKVCLDLANGHMKSVLDACINFKKVCKDNGVECTIMTGNIANPKWVRYMNKNYTSENTPIDYVRCGIGGGSMCITSTQTKIHFPMGSLIEECAYANSNKVLKIVADGGIKGYGDVITALGLGADYVMIGGLFARSMEACGTMYTKKGKLHYEDVRFNFNIYSDEKYKKELLAEYRPYRNYYGMASKKAQKEFGGDGSKTAEGKSDIVNVEYTLNGWIDNMISYLRSAMSYTNSFTLDDFRMNVEFVVNSSVAINAVNK